MNVSTAPDNQSAAPGRACPVAMPVVSTSPGRLTCWGGRSRPSEARTVLISPGSSTATLSDGACLRRRTTALGARGEDREDRASGGVASCPGGCRPAESPIHYSRLPVPPSSGARAGKGEGGEIMSGPRKGRRQLASLVGELSQRDLAILADVARLRLTSTRQLERLHFGATDGASALSAARGCRRSLERLVRDRLLLRLDRRIGGLRAGSAAFIYATGPAGQRVIGDAGPRRRFREPSAVFVEHTLAVAEVYVRLHEDAASGDVRLMTIEAEPRCWRAVNNLGARSMLKPDLFVSLEAGELEYRWFVEIDLGTEHQPAIVRKCLTYEAYYRSGVEQAAHDVFPRVLWVAPDEPRARAIARTINRANQLTRGLFVVVTTQGAVAALRGGQP